MQEGICVFLKKFFAQAAGLKTAPPPQSLTVIGHISVSTDGDGFA